MAATIAYCTGYDSSREKTEHRLGSQAAEGRAATWRTEAVAYVDRDGSGYVLVRNLRSGETIHRYEFGPESER